MLFYVDVVLSGGGFYLGKLFEDAILKGLLLSKSSQTKKIKNEKLGKTLN